MILSRITSGPITRKPSASSISRTTADRMLSSPSMRVPTLARNFAERASRMSSKTDGRGILPTRTSSSTPSRRALSKALLRPDIRIHWTGASSRIAGSALPSKARTKKSRPVSRQAEITWPGSAPPPAITPSLGTLLRFGLTDCAARIRSQKIDDFHDRFVFAKALVHVLEPLCKRAFFGEHQPVGLAKCGYIRP